MIVNGIPRGVEELQRPDFVRSSVPEWAAGAALPFEVRRITLRPGETTVPHSHHDTEVWFVLSGRGEVRCEGRTEPACAGDTVTLPPLDGHSLHNSSADEPLTFMSLWWEDMTGLAEAAVRRAVSPGDAVRPTLLLPSFPTPNGELHLGHLAGPYLAADTVRRVLLTTGTPAHVLLGTVGHQSQVAAAAAAEGLTFYELAERNTDAIQQALTAAGMPWDVFVRPSSTRYPELAVEVFERLRNTGAVQARKVPQPFCEHCRQYLFEAFLTGGCPHCGSRDTAGIECEACALPFADAELVDPGCARCGRPAALRDLTRWFLPLEPLRDRLTGYLATVGMSSRLRGYVHRVLAGPLPDLPVSVIAADGVPLPGGDGQVMYSAFELAARYLTAVDELARGHGLAGWPELARAWRPRTLLAFGFDNAYLRAVVFPAVLGAFTDLLELPDTLICNEFYTLDGSKFSTGRNHAIWGRQAFDPAGRDQLRLYLALTRPQDRRSDFSVAAYRRFVIDELAGWQDWLDGVQDRLHRHFDGVVPAAGTFFPEAEDCYTDLQRLAARAARSYRPDRLSTRSAVQAACDLVATARRFAPVAEDLLGVPGLSGQARTAMALELMAVRTLAEAISPIAPDLAARLAAAIGQDTAPAPQPVPRWATPGTRAAPAVAITVPPAALAADAAGRPGDTLERNAP